VGGLWVGGGGEMRGGEKSKSEAPQGESYPSSLVNHWDLVPPQRVVFTYIKRHWNPEVEDGGFPASSHHHWKFTQ